MIKYLLIPLLLLGACSTFTPEQQAKMDSLSAQQEQLAQNFTTFVDGLADYSQRAAELFQKALDEPLTPEEAVELNQLLLTGPEDIREAASEATALATSWWEIQEQKNAIRDDAGGGWWEEALLWAGSAFLIGQGVPTSGPVAPFLSWLQPLLEAAGLRNGRRREEKRKQYTQSEASD